MARPHMLLALALAVTGCEPDNPSPPPSAPSATTAAATATPTESIAAPAAPKALEVEELKKALKCGGGGHGPCGVLDELHDCVAWSPVTKGGDGRWLGEAFVVKNGAFIDDFGILRSKGVPPGDVGPGQFPVKIGIDTIPDSLDAERRHAERAVRAYKRGDVTLPTNQAVRYVKDRPDWPEAFAMQAEGHQVFAAVAGGAYLCARKDQRLIVVKRAGSRSHPADGIYAVLWPVTW